MESTWAMDIARSILGRKKILNLISGPKCVLGWLKLQMDYQSILLCVIAVSSIHSSAALF